MKPNNAGRDMWLRAQTVNQKFNENVQTQDTYVMLYLCFVFAKYDTATGYISRIIDFMGGRGGESEFSTPTFPLRLLPHDMQHLEMKAV